MVRGVGIDVVDVRDFEERIRRTPALKERLFTERELALSYSLDSLAGRFAVKEAIFKALGVGLTGGVRWKDVEVVGGRREPPKVVLHGRVKKLAEGTTLHVSVSHAGGMVVGICVATFTGTSDPS